MSSRPDEPILVVASRNSGKVRELRDLLAALPLRVVSLSDLPCAPELDEPYDDFLANAAAKATGAARAIGHLALADDSGLVVPALGGAPGVRSSRVAGSDPERIAWLLAEMRELTGEQRSAHFICVAVLADPAGNRLGTWAGRVEGVILAAPQGSGGFGYDPVFWYPPAQMTFAQMTARQKNEVSHRGRALRACAQDLPALLARLREREPTR